METIHTANTIELFDDHLITEFQWPIQKSMDFHQKEDVKHMTQK